MIQFNPNLIAKGGGASLVKTVAAAIIIPDSVTDEKIGNSYLGTPVIDNLEFPQGAYTDLEGNTITYGAVVIDTVVFSVNKVKNIVKEKIQGRNGTVKEYVSDGDYVINCQGMISNKSNSLPEDQARSLVSVFNVPESIPIVSLYLNNVHEIFDVVIESWTMPITEAKRNSIPFSFTALSDVPVTFEELKIE